MKKSIVLLTISALAFVGCEQRDDSASEAAGAQKDQAEAALDTEKERLDAQKEQIESQAKAEKEQIEAQADAQKAQLKAEEKQLEASAEAQKAQAEAQEAQAEAQQDAQQAQADAQQKQAEAQQDAQQAQAEAQQDAQQAQAESQQQIQESAGAAASDKDLETQVRTTLMGDTTQPTAGTQNVQITVKEGKVTLTGTVQSEDQKKQLEQQAKGIQGVKSVENNLKVQNQ